MGSVDSTSKVFVQKPEIFKDIFRLVFNIVANILEVNPVEPELLFAQRLPAHGQSKRARRRQRANKALQLIKFTRDIVKSCICATNHDADYMVLAIENQTHVDDFMPARVMIYDAMTLHTQIEVLKSQTWPSLSSDAFLNGVPRGTKLKPVITVVCYFGTKPWDGPRSLHEIFEIKDPKFKDFIPNYPIYIIDPHALSEAQLQMLETSLREVFMCIKASGNRKSLKEVVNSSPRFQHMDTDAVHLIKAALNLDIKIDSEQKETNMCQAVEEWKQELLDEGKAQGEKVGYANGQLEMLKNIIQNTKLSLIEIAQMTGQPLSLIQSLVK